MVSNKDNRRKSGERAVKGTSGKNAYDAVRRRIVSLDLRPGSTLEEAALVKELGISRTPLREALIRLAAEGLVELLPNRGTRVAPLTLTRLQEHVEALDLIQRVIMRLAAVRRTADELATIDAHRKSFEMAAEANDTSMMIEANHDFHVAIGVASHNDYFRKSMEQIMTDGLRIARLAMTYESYGTREEHDKHIGAIIREHREMVERIEKGEVVEAEEVARAHARLTANRAMNYLSMNLAAGVEISPSQARGVA